MPLVELAINNEIAQVTLNRPDKLNALNFKMFQELEKVRRQLLARRSLRAIILRGEGKDFCSGLDVKSVMGNKFDAIRLLWKWRPGAMNLAQRVAAGWRVIPVPVIAAIHGRCWGGGMQIALGADFRIAHPKSSLSIMEAKWGLIPDMGGTLALNELMPIDRAMKFAMSAERITAERALQANLVTELNDQPLEQALQFANELASRSPDTNAAIKMLYHRSWCPNQSAILRRESGYQIKILLGKNQSIAVKRELGDTDKSFRARLPW